MSNFMGWNCVVLDYNINSLVTGSHNTMSYSPTDFESLADVTLLPCIILGRGSNTVNLERFWPLCKTKLSQLEQNMCDYHYTEHELLAHEQSYVTTPDESSGNKSIMNDFVKRQLLFWKNIYEAHGWIQKELCLRQHAEFLAALLCQPRNKKNRVLRTHLMVEYANYQIGEWIFVEERRFQLPHRTASQSTMPRDRWTHAWFLKPVQQAIVCLESLPDWFAGTLPNDFWF